MGQRHRGHSQRHRGIIRPAFGLALIECVGAPARAGSAGACSFIVNVINRRSTRKRTPSEVKFLFLLIQNKCLAAFPTQYPLGIETLVGGQGKRARIAST